MRQLVTASIDALRPYEAGKPIEELERELGVHDAVKLASNENPLGPSPRAIAAMQAELEELHRYPDASAYRLKRGLALHHGVDMSELVVGSGSNEVIELLIRTFTTREHHIVFAEPSFVVYRLAALAHGVPFTAVPLENQTHDLSAMRSAVTEATRLLFIANPNNPTGTYVGRAALEALLRDTPDDVIIAVDEAYFEYADAPDYPDSMTLRRIRERFVILRTFSKIHGLAALRVGYGVAPPALVEYMNRVRAPFNVGTLGQVAALAALEDAEHIARSRRLNAAERRRLTDELGRLGVVVTPSQANFVFIDVRRPARPVYEALLRRGVIVRPFGGLENNLRVTVGTAAENDRFLEALGEVLR